jgi:hypothetical protein
LIDSREGNHYAGAITRGKQVSGAINPAQVNLS